MSETALVNSIIGALGEHNPHGKFMKMHGTPFAVAGTPDIVGTLTGRFIGIEVKLPDTGVVSDAQMRQIMLWRIAGAHVGIATSIPEAFLITVNTSSHRCSQCGQLMTPWPDDQIGLGWAYVHCSHCNMGEPIKEEDVFKLS